MPDAPQRMPYRRVSSIAEVASLASTIQVPGPGTGLKRGLSLRVPSARRLFRRPSNTAQEAQQHHPPAAVALDALEEAVWHDDGQRVRTLLRTDATASLEHVNVTRGWPLLHIAVQRASPDVVLDLLNAGNALVVTRHLRLQLIALVNVMCAGAPVNAHADDGTTALFRAVRVRRLDIVHILLGRGATMHANGDDATGITPLMEAAIQCDVQMTELLLDHLSADKYVSQRMPVPQPSLLWPLSQCVRPHYRTTLALALLSECRSGQTALSYACAAIQQQRSEVHEWEYNDDDAAESNIGGSQAGSRARAADPRKCDHWKQTRLLRPASTSQLNFTVSLTRGIRCQRGWRCDNLLSCQRHSAVQRCHQL